MALYCLSFKNKSIHDSYLYIFKYYVLCIYIYIYTNSGFISVYICCLLFIYIYIYINNYINIYFSHVPIHIDADMSFHNSIYASIILCRYVYLYYISFPMRRA